MSANGDNLVLLPEFVDRYVELVSVEFIRIDRAHSDLKYDITILDVSNNFTVEGMIKWSIVYKHFKHELANMVKIAGDTVINENGSGYNLYSMLYEDFATEEEFIGFYLPTSPYTHRACEVLAEKYDQIRDELRALPKVSHLKLSDQKFTKQVLVYHEGSLSSGKQRQLKLLYQSKGLRIDFKGPECCLTTGWAHDRMIA